MSDGMTSSPAAAWHSDVKDNFVRVDIQVLWNSNGGEAKNLKLGRSEMIAHEGYCGGSIV